jgi:hypothetical protein
MIYNKPDMLYNNQINNGLLAYGEIRNNLVFNYLDYLLWSSSSNEIFPNNGKFGENYSKENYEAARKNFVFTFRSSVEHYYSQNPNPETGEKVIDKGSLDCFGNLCLVTHEQNSSLSNNGTKAKKERYYAKHVNYKKPDSMKQYLMMSYSEWSPGSIEDHDRKMYNLLKNDFDLWQEAQSSREESN